MQQASTTVRQAIAALAMEIDTECPVIRKLEAQLETDPELRRFFAAMDRRGEAERCERRSRLATLRIRERVAQRRLRCSAQPQRRPRAMTCRTPRRAQRARHVRSAVRPPPDPEGEPEPPDDRARLRAILGALIEAARAGEIESARDRLAWSLALSSRIGGPS